MDPAGTLSITGLAAELSFFKGTLDWVGIEAQMVQVGRYKGAAEPFTRTGPSKELKGEYDKLLDDLYEQLSEQIARQRRLSVPHVLHVIDAGPLAAEDARRHRLVDRLVSKADWRESVEKTVRGAKHASVDWLADYARKPTKPLDLSNPWALFGMMLGSRPAEKVREPTIALIHANGVIVSGNSGEGLLGTRRVGARTMAKCFRQVARDDKVKAVILRVNSPGGSAIASELIYQAVRKCARKKPVIVSISSVGASGGYYIALGGRKILADPAATVGSVGVISGKLAMTGLMEKVGITTYEITRGRNAGLWLSRPWDEREREIIRRMSTRTYDMFVSRVRDSRGKRIKNLNAVTQRADRRDRGPSGGGGGRPVGRQDPAQLHPDAAPAQDAPRRAVRRSAIACPAGGRAGAADRRTGLTGPACRTPTPGPGLPAEPRADVRVRGRPDGHALSRVDPSLAHNRPWPSPNRSTCSGTAR